MGFEKLPDGERLDASIPATSYLLIVSLLSFPQVWLLCVAFLLFGAVQLIP